MQGVIQAIRGTHHIYVDDAILIAGKTKFRQNVIMVKITLKDP